MTGFVQKQRDDSEQLSDGKIKRLQENCRDIAMNEWAIIAEFLALNANKYPLYYSRRSQVFAPVFRNVNRTKYI
jgi:hypothetical protein